MTQPLSGESRPFISGHTGEIPVDPAPLFHGIDELRATIRGLEAENARLLALLRDARNCMHGNDIVRRGVRLTERIDAVLDGSR